MSDWTHTDASGRTIIRNGEAVDDEAPPESCGSCGADIGPSSTFPWHYDDEDCRAVREPVPAE